MTMKVTRCEFAFGLTCKQVVERMAEIEAQNAKLRELVHILCHCMNLHAKCDDCRLNGSKGEIAHDKLCACDGLYKMLRELGIEVPGDGTH